MSAFAYRAFISYNRADSAIAAALAVSLSRFARPWFAMRAMRVFLDKNSLATDPTLSGAIDRGLAQSEWVILLASPASAASPWVCHEVAWWVAHRPLSKMIIARLPYSSSRAYGPKTLVRRTRASFPSGCTGGASKVLSRIPTK